MGVILQVRLGEELRELQNIYRNAKVAGNPFPLLNVTYKYQLEGSGQLDEADDFQERGTVDCGGPIRSFLCSCWNQFWNDAFVSELQFYSICLIGMYLVINWCICYYQLARIARMSI